MANWRTEKRMYVIIESRRNKREEYHMLATGNEISKWCKAKNEMYGYIPGLGGDRNYTCFAYYMTY